MRYYDLVPEEGFEIDFDSVEKLLDERTKIWYIVNPSNPCGSVFSRSHMEDITKFSNKHQLIILVDEIYHGMAYGENPFIPLADVALDIPLITIGGLSKIYGVPGWRLGWIIVHNRHGFLTEIIEGMKNVSDSIGVWINSIV